MNSNRMAKSKVKFNFNDKSASLSICFRVVNEVVSCDGKEKKSVAKNEAICMESKGTEF